MSGAVDHEARQAAALAKAQIDAHEDRCSERWAEARDMLKRLADRIWWVGAGVAATAITGLIALVFKLW